MGLFDFLTGKGKSALGRSATAPPADEVKKEIEKHGLDTSKIDIKVDGRKVTLGGNASTTADVEKIGSVTGNIRGVAQIENNIVAVSADPESKLYTVRAGDTLWKIAESHYGKGMGAKYAEIYEANRPLLKDPNKIYPGQKLRIPKHSP
ncbi:MAG: peptidoglycan-binding protein LysM [Methylocystis sp.]|uniref:peptidoglycan-binding protein LysM n=1 Tax=Methylocystis sp. TaxID=1911079 RepID=UPI003DA4EC80